MWAYLSTWLVQDGEVPELSPGDRLGPAGLCLEASRLRAGFEGEQDATEAVDDRASGALAYRITGTVGVEIGYTDGWERSPSSAPEFVLTSQQQRYIIAAPPTDDPMVPHSRVTFSGSLWVIPTYEFEEFGLPEIRVNWQVRSIMAEDRALVPDATGVRTTGPLIGRRTLDRMRMWDDDNAHDDDITTTYLVDLDRSRAS